MGKARQTERQLQSIDDISPVHQDYLKAIWSASELQTVSVTTSFLSNKLKINASTVSEAVKRLVEQGLVDHQPYGNIELTELGTHFALLMIRRHRMIETFLTNYLDYSWDAVHHDAERLEHAVSETFLDALERKLGYPKYDPHGDPIPTKNGDFPVCKVSALTDIPLNHEASITRIYDDNPELLRYCRELGFVLGARVKVTEHLEFAGTITVLLNGEKHITIGNQVAETILVGYDPA